MMASSQVTAFENIGNNYVIIGVNGYGSQQWTVTWGHCCDGTNIYKNCVSFTYNSTIMGKEHAIILT